MLVASAAWGRPYPDASRPSANSSQGSVRATISTAHSRLYVVGIDRRGEQQPRWRASSGRIKKHHRQKEAQDEARGASFGQQLVETSA
jgi:hypothetical protein